MRYERKFRLENVHFQTILQYIRLHPAGMKTIYPNRQINNIYFDTPALTTYKENVMGLAERKKFRVRWYGTDIHRVENPLLEIKGRHSELGTKDHAPVSVFALDDLAYLTEEVNAQSGCDALLLPVLLNSYHRAYFGTNDEKFRLTLDWDLRYTSLLRTPHFTRHRLAEPNVCVVELKYEQELEHEADRIVQFLPFARTKNSKYVTGIELCHS